MHGFLLPSPSGEGIEGWGILLGEIGRWNLPLIQAPPQPSLGAVLSPGQDQKAPSSSRGGTYEPRPPPRPARNPGPATVRYFGERERRIRARRGQARRQRKSL